MAVVTQAAKRGRKPKTETASADAPVEDAVAAAAEPPKAAPKKTRAKKKAVDEATPPAAVVELPSEVVSSSRAGTTEDRRRGRKKSSNRAQVGDEWAQTVANLTVRTSTDGCVRHSVKHSPVVFKWRVLAWVVQSADG